VSILGNSWPRSSIFIFGFGLSQFIVSWSIIEVLFREVDPAFEYIMFGGILVAILLEYISARRADATAVLVTFGWNVIALLVVSLLLAGLINLPTHPLFKTSYLPAADSLTTVLLSVDLAAYFVFSSGLAFGVMMLACSGYFFTVDRPGGFAPRFATHVLALAGLASLDYIFLDSFDLRSVFLLGAGVQVLILLAMGTDAKQGSIVPPLPRPEAQPLPRPWAFTFRGVRMPRQASLFLGMLECTVGIGSAMLLLACSQQKTVASGAFGAAFLLAILVMLFCLFVFHRSGFQRCVGAFSIANGLVIACFAFTYNQNIEISVMLCGYLLGNSLPRIFLLPALASQGRADGDRNAMAIIAFVVLLLLGAMLFLSSSKFLNTSQGFVEPVGLVLALLPVAIGILLYLPLSRTATKPLQEVDG